MTVAIDEAIEGVVVSDYARDIKAALDYARECEADANTHHWNAAELIVQALDSGMKQADLAAEVGCQQPKISKYASVYRAQAGKRGRRPQWRDVYKSVNGEDKPAVEAEPEVPAVPAPAAPEVPAEPATAVGLVFHPDHLPSPVVFAKKLHDLSRSYAINLRTALDQLIEAELT